MTSRHVAVIDIGKTNAKLALVDLSDLAEIAVITRPNTVLPGPPWPHYDVEGHWTFLLDGLRRFQAEHGVDAISITTHGACAALLDHDGKLAAPILDYEHAGPDSVAADYDAIRPSFTETGSPKLGAGLNIGAQLFWQFRQDPNLRQRTRHIVTYPQYWAYRLTGVAATEATSLGCHTDLWSPFAGAPSSLVARLGIAGMLAPTRPADAILDCIQPHIATRTGLSPDTPVYCGIHDSNASLLPHLLTQDTPFSVVSTGTWVIAMAIGGDTITLDPSRDTLVNVDAFGKPVPSARFMGGREHDLLLGDQWAEPSEADIAQILNSATMLLPAVERSTGPFHGHHARWIGEEPALQSGGRSAAVGFYLALMTAACLALIGHRGPIRVEGPFARNQCYLDMLAAAAGTEVYAMTGTTGTSQGAALLVGRMSRPASEGLPTATTGTERHRSYARQWRENLGQ